MFGYIYLVKTNIQLNNKMFCSVSYACMEGSMNCKKKKKNKNNNKQTPKNSYIKKKKYQIM